VFGKQCFVLLQQSLSYNTCHWCYLAVHGAKECRQNTNAKSNWHVCEYFCRCLQYHSHFIIILMILYLLLYYLASFHILHCLNANSICLFASLLIHFLLRFRFGSFRPLAKKTAFLLTISGFWCLKFLSVKLIFVVVRLNTTKSTHNTLCVLSISCSCALYL